MVETSIEDGRVGHISAVVAIAKAAELRDQTKHVANGRRFTTVRSGLRQDVASTDSVLASKSGAERKSWARR